jgi:hypothetical protein
MQVFISHALEDEAAAAALKEMIQRCSLNKIDVWFSSDRSALGGISMGGSWFSELNDKLKGTTWIVALVTPQSVLSPWLFFECGFVVCNRAHSVVPLTLGLPTSAVPMPLAAYQIYDSTTATSLATFLEKLLVADNIPYGEEMTKSIREKSQRRLIDHQNNAQIKIASVHDESFASGEITALKNFIEQRFVELYKTMPTDKISAIDLELTFDVSEIVNNKPPVALNISSRASVIDVFQELYFRLQDQVPAFTYLIDWTVVDTHSSKELSILEFAQRVPANLIFRTGGQYKVRKLQGGDDYIKMALRVAKATSRTATGD